MSLALETLCDRVARGEAVDFCFFWDDTPRPDGQLSDAVFSQWWPAPMTVDGIEYPAAEHYMMAEKARLFGDAEARARILATPYPREAKQLGRGVRGFDKSSWVAARFDIVVRGNLAKFGQHDDLRAFLLDTDDRILVEAAPQDRIWGIGLTADDPRARQPSGWPGLNLLGFALMAVREGLRP